MTETDRVNGNPEWAGSGAHPKAHRCNSLFTCFDGQPSRGSGSGSADFTSPRVVGSLGDSTWFGADAEAAAAAAAAASPVLSMSDKYNAQFTEVRKLLKAKGLFTDATVDAHSLEYYNHLGLNEFYFQTANPAAIAENLLAVIAARALHSASGADYFPEIRQVDEKTGDVFALARASLKNRKASQNYKVEQQFELEFLDMGLSGNKQQMRMQCYRSTGSVFGIDGDTERLRTYFFQKPKFPLEPEQLSPTETNISKLLDVDFYASKKRTVTASIFQKLNSQVPRGKGYRIDLAFRRGRHTEDLFSRLGDCVTMWGFYSQRKYVEPLANGATIITSFVETLPTKELIQADMTEDERINNLLTDLRMQFAMPKTKFLNFARDRILTVHEAAYAMSACQFALYFSGTVGHSFPQIEKLVKQFGGKSLTMQEIASKSVGFHVRFADVARGGVRVVQSVGTVAYERNKKTVLDEVFKLAFTQQFKNKDISEGGSKGIILLNKARTLHEAQQLTPMAFKAYVDNMLDLLLPHHDVLDLVGVSEVCFLGPDENTGTGGLVDWAALRAKERGAWFWKAFTTGKAPSKGGIPHDVFGMTTASVETYVQGIYEKLGLKEEEVTRIQTGGPDGDLGCNALLQTKSKTIAVVDGSGVLYDPKDGTRVASGFEFRNTFHLSTYATADLFNPCGGRPASITPQNVDKLFDPRTGEKKFKYIVEGANVFITDDARRILEDRGVILFKDASTNKGGVTSSSHEVLAALALTQEEFAEHMQAILERIRENAKLEFEALWSEAKRTGMNKCDLTDILSRKIIQLKQDIGKSNALWRDKEFVNFVLNSAIPDVLVPGLISVETFRQRVPEPYQKAIFTTFLASRFFYKQPFTEDVSAFAFIAYLDEMREQMAAAAK
ncbi:hypothetical protein Emag_000900 [Eimeria magna]